MARIYPDPPSNVTEPIQQLLKYINDCTDGTWAIGILIAITVVSYVSLAKHSQEHALIPTFLIGFISALMFRTLGLISDLYLTIYVILLIVSIVFLHLKRVD